MTSEAGELFRQITEKAQTTYLELFFEVVFVFALRALAQGLLGKLTWVGAYQMLVLLLAIGWVWSLTVRVTNQLNPRRMPVQLIVLATMVGALVLSAAVPEAFGRTGLIFAVTYLAVQLGRATFLVIIWRGQEAQRVAERAMIWHIATAVPWVLGALTSGAARTALWTVAVVLIYLARWFNYPVPGIRRFAGAELPPGGEYLAERHRALFVIALGEAVLAIGSTLTERGFDIDRTAAFVVSFFLTALIWRIYIFRAGEEIGPAIQASADPKALISLLSYAHLAMIAGVVVISVSDELVIDDPLGHPRPEAITIVGGPTLFLIGRAFLQYLVYGRVWGGRVIGIVALACLVPPMMFVPPLIAATATGTVLTGVVLYDNRIQHRRRPSVSPPDPHLSHDA